MIAPVSRPAGQIQLFVSGFRVTREADVPLALDKLPFLGGAELRDQVFEGQGVFRFVGKPGQKSRA